MFMVVILEITVETNVSKGNSGTFAGIGQSSSNPNKDVLGFHVCAMELWTVGYALLLKLFHGKEPDHLSPQENYEWVPLSVDFGIPLFSPKLCNKICKKEVSSDFLQIGSFSEYDDAMQSLRKKLRDICAEYQATGPAAKLLYQKENAKQSSR
ncbi:hypothetical protein QN277_028568 [Acacia crassicarpa]|nr:hypothetical protein QN277_028568 [Acacia crassicarpa]